MIFADNSGKVYELSLSRAISDNDFSYKQLPSSHHPNTMMNFFTLNAKMSPQGLLSSIGEPSPEETPLYVNIFNVGSAEDLSCVVLMGLQAGYGSTLQPEQINGSALYLTTWLFTDISHL